MRTVNFVCRLANQNGGLDILVCVDEFVGKPRLFDRPECRNCVFKGGSYCWNQCPYNVKRKL